MPVKHQTDWIVKFKYCGKFCVLGAPILLSWPHFLWGDSEYIIEGIEPFEEKHKTYVDIEPVLKKKTILACIHVHKCLFIYF